MLWTSNFLLSMSLVAVMLNGSSNLGHRYNAECACPELGVTGPSPQEIARTGASGSKTPRASSGATSSSSFSFWRSKESFWRSRASRAAMILASAGCIGTNSRGVGQILELTAEVCGEIDSCHLHARECWRCVKGNETVLMGLH